MVGWQSRRRTTGRAWPGPGELRSSPPALAAENGLPAAITLDGGRGAVCAAVTRRAAAGCGRPPGAGRPSASAHQQGGGSWSAVRAVPAATAHGIPVGRPAAWRGGTRGSHCFPGTRPPNLRPCPARGTHLATTWPHQPFPHYRAFAPIPATLPTATWQTTEAVGPAGPTTPWGCRGLSVAPAGASPAQPPRPLQFLAPHTRPPVGSPVAPPPLPVPSPPI